MNRYIEVLELWQSEGRTIVTEEEREELFAIRSQVARMAADMASKVILTLGGTSIYKGDPVELFMRDLSSICFTSKWFMGRCEWLHMEEPYLADQVHPVW